jgi:hypothetical protein
MIWTAITAAVMFALAARKARTGRARGDPVLRTKGRVTLIDGILATTAVADLVLNAALGCGGPTRRRVRAAFHAARGVREIFTAH